MKKYLFILIFCFYPNNYSKADMFGGDLVFLMQIVFNTLHTLYELERQSTLLKEQMEGISDKINRIKTISELVQPSTWDKWQNPKEALNRIKLIYHTLPKEYRSEKSDLIEEEISKAMNIISKISREAHTTFLSGKELERRGADASPGVAAKLTASGVGTLVSMEAQSQIIQSHMVSILTQMLAQANEKESREVLTKGTRLTEVSKSLGGKSGWFSELVTPFRSNK